MNDASADGRKQRRESRHACPQTISILPVTAEKDWIFLKAELVDASPHGIGLISDRPWKASDQFLAKLKVRKKALMVLYAVRYCHASGQNRFHVGAEYCGVTANPYDDVETILAAWLAQAGAA